MRTVNKNYILILVYNLRFLFLLFIFENMSIKAQEDINPIILAEDASLLYLKDYNEKGFIMTTKKLFFSKTLEYSEEFTTEYPSYSVFTTYGDTQYILTACTNDNLLGQLDTQTLIESQLFSYNSFSSLSPERNLCSLSFLDPYAFLVHTVIKNENEIALFFLKIEISSGTNGPILGNSPNYFDTAFDLNVPSDFKYISCDVIIASTIYALICGYVDITSTGNYEYRAFITNMNFKGLDTNSLVVFKSDILYDFSVERIDNDYIRYIIGNNSFEIYAKYLGSYFSMYKVSDELKNQYLYSFNSNGYLFYYNNENIFHLVPIDDTNLNYNLYITNTTSNNNLIITLTDKSIEELYGFFDQVNKKYIIIYQYSNKIEYFIIDYYCLFNAWERNENNEKICYENQNYCETKEYFYHTDTRECTLTSCNIGYYQFNFECYKNKCPENTKDVNNTCECKYKYFIEEGKLNCFSEETTCESINYPIESNNNQCFLTKESCIENGNKIFNNICYINSCPDNSYDENNDGNCFCSYNYFYDSENNLYECFTNEDTCETKLYPYKDLDGKECYTSLNDCISKNKKIFNNECYTLCPENTIMKEDDNSTCICENYFFYDEDNQIFNCFTSDNECMDINDEYKYTNTETKECFKTKTDCLNKNGNNEICKYYEECDPNEDYIFDGECFIHDCPEGTKIDPENPLSKNCVCEEDSKIDEITGKIICIPRMDEGENESENISYTDKSYEEKNEAENDHETDHQVIPSEHYSNKENCPFIYKGNCVLKCGVNTCLNPNLKELVECIDITENMKVFNNICITGIDRIVNNFITNDNSEEIKPISTPSGTIIYGYPLNISQETLIEKNPNLTYIDLGNCKYKLIEAYNLDNETELFVLGIDSPNININSSINVFNYEIYLKNGTQLKDLTPCNETKISTSSKINNLEVIKFEKAKEFSNIGYDIYDKSNIFYTDNCAPANDNGNDITLEDRETYYYPGGKICNEGCEYASIDFDTQRFICQCNVTTNQISENKNNKTSLDKKEEDDESYFEYFLSLINYKIIKCYSLINNFENFYYNGGLYVGSIIFFIDFILIFVFCIKSISSIKIQLFKNMPTREKLIQIAKENIKNKNKIININNPPKKNKSVKNFIYFNNYKTRKRTENELLQNKQNNNENKKNKNTNYNKTQKRFGKNLIKFGNHNNNINKTTNLDSKITLKNISKINKNKFLENNDIEFNTELTFSHLIDINDEEIDKKEFNEIPYQQALRIDNRNFFEILFSVLINKIAILNLLFCRSPYSYFSLSLSIYLFELLLDVSMNCFLYSDDVVSEKYHNNGSLSWFTSFSLSIISNIISSIITSMISNLTDYSEIFESIIKYVKIKRKYFENIIRFLKYIKIRLTIFYIIEIIFIIVMTYYLFIFSTVYHHSQISIIINYIIGVFTSLAFSVGITLIISILRVISIKYHSSNLYNTSKYLYRKF